MNSLPPYILPLGCFSLFVSAAVLVLGALALPITPALWIIPGAFTCTLIYHAFIITLFTPHTGPSKRACSILSVSGAYALTILWIGVLAISFTFTLLLSLGKIDPLPSRPKLNIILTVATALSSFQPIILATTGLIFHKRRKQEQYREKWRWKIQINNSNWSIGQD